VLKLIRRRDGQVLMRLNNRSTWNLKRPALITIGWLFVVGGIAGLFLPLLQGILFLLIGFVILSREYRWARTLVSRLRCRFPSLNEWLGKARARAGNILGSSKNEGERNER
jgi:hypothetical protein